METTNLTERVNPAPKGARPRRDRMVALALSALSLALLGCLGCGLITLVLRGFSLLTYPWMAGNVEQQVVSTANNRYLAVFVEAGMTGVFTPTGSAGQGIFSSPALDGTVVGIPPLDELAEKGYVAVRVPHAPPTYTASSIVPGIDSLNALEFSYYSPPETTTVTTVPISITRRTEYESIVNARFPITDGKSHWEVWWIPAGYTLPIPAQPFRLGEGWPDPFRAKFMIDFGSGMDARACAGCLVEYLLYNGYTFIGPFGTTLHLADYSLPNPYALPGNPLVAFGPHCGSPTLAQNITPTVPFTHVLWLESYDTVTRTFTIAASSSENWGYTYYYRESDQAAPVPVAGAPFTVTVGPKPAHGWPDAGCMGLMAVHTPTIAVTDRMRETFTITATSTISPEVQATTYSFAFAPSYQLNEGFRVYLPVVREE